MRTFFATGRAEDSLILTEGQGSALAFSFAPKHDDHQALKDINVATLAKEGSPFINHVAEFAPELAQLTKDLVFKDIWERPGLSKRDRSLITVTTLVATGRLEPLVDHFKLARQNGISEDELREILVHLAFYTGWPSAMSAARLAAEVFSDAQGKSV